jgi:hypothetical protein
MVSRLDGRRSLADAGRCQPMLAWMVEGQDPLPAFGGVVGDIWRLRLVKQGNEIVPNFRLTLS